MIIRLVRATVGRFEYDAKTQYKFHLVATWIWLAALLVVPFFIQHGTREQWATLLILEVSLYANFATEFGAMSAALSAEQEQRCQPFTNPNYNLPDMASRGEGWDEAESEAFEEAGF